VQKIHVKFSCMREKIHVKVRLKARPFHSCKLFNFLEGNLSQILMKVQFVRLKAVFNC
jgi:hypothetical protein